MQALQEDSPPASALPLPLRWSHESLRPGAIGRWLIAGGRAAFGRAPGWSAELQATPMALLWLVALSVGLEVLLGRLYVTGSAVFSPQALVIGWIDTLALAWLALLVRSPQVSAAHVLAVSLALGWWISLLTGVFWVAALHGGLWDIVAWWLLAQCVFFARQAHGHAGVAGLSLAVLLAVQALALRWPLPDVWVAQASAEAPADEPARLRVTEAVLQAQPVLLDRALSELKPQRPGVVDLYVLTFAPYGDEDVFRREGELVASVMARRFDADGRTVQLLNHPATALQRPWATPGHLRRAIERVARVMDPREDVLFLHLTSHGARGGELATSLWPLEFEPVTPGALRDWLDRSGVRHRVISISACFSGSWLPVLANEDSLVMSAADAEHTSYGCGRLSELTFFGRAMFDEELRTRTRSFELAHARSRDVIRQREIDAGKDDGYSNPQIRVGSRIRTVLAHLERRLEAAPGGR